MSHKSVRPEIFVPHKSEMLMNNILQKMYEPTSSHLSHQSRGQHNSCNGESQDQQPQSQHIWNGDANTDLRCIHYYLFNSLDTKTLLVGSFL